MADNLQKNKFTQYYRVQSKIIIWKKISFMNTSNAYKS
jgi:hypothetical protein